MSEETTATEAPVQEVAAQEPVATQPQEQPTEQKSVPRSPREFARQQASERVQVRLDKHVKSEAAKTQPRDGHGNFVKADGESAAEAEESPADPPEAEATAETPSAEIAQEEEVTEPVGEESRLIRVEIPSDHPALQGIKGVDALEVSTPEQEQFIKAVLNGSHTRRREVEAANVKLAERDAKLAELNRKLIAYEAGEAAVQKYKQSPKYQARVDRYNEIKDTLGQEAASEYWEAVHGDLRQIQEEEEGARWGEVQQRQVQEAAESWTNDAWERNTARIPDVVMRHPQINMREIFQQEVNRFDRDIQSGYYPHVTDSETMNKEFDKILHARIMNEPVVKEMVERGKQNAQAPQQQAAPQKSQEQIEAEVKERLLKELAENRKANPRHPMGSLTHAAEGTNNTVSRPDRAELPSHVSGRAAGKFVSRTLADTLARKYVGNSK